MRVKKPFNHTFIVCLANLNKHVRPRLSRSSNKGKKKKVETKTENEPQFRKLRTLDVFAGCGGLSAGFHQVRNALVLIVHNSLIFCRK